MLLRCVRTTYDHRPCYGRLIVTVLPPASPACASYQGANYARNKFSFNVSFVFPEDAVALCASHEGVLRKLGSALVTLEMESEFLRHPSSKASAVVVRVSLRVLG